MSLAFAPIKRSGITLAAVVVCYWVYSVAAVPLIEPAAVARSDSGSSGNSGGKPSTGNRYHDQLVHYFQPTDWELTKSPKVLESEQGMLLVQDYKNLPDGRVELRPCTLIFFPRGAVEGVNPAEREAIVMRAVEGAILEFDQPFDLKRARIGKLVGGELVGQISIDSVPKRPGAPNDLHIVTRNVKLENDQVWTPETVEFRLGPNHGYGRELIMKLMPQGEEDDEQKTPGRLESMQLTYDVKLHLEMNGASLLPNGERKPASRSSSKEPPLEVTSKGPFEFDFQSYIATFSKQVDVMRLNPQGPSDQMNCEMLAVYFGPKSGAGGQPTSSKNRMPKLEPRLIEASGNPVVVQAPSQQGHVRCQRLEYDVLAQRITLEGSDDVLLHQGTNEIRTRRLDFQPAAGTLGKLLASGPGWLQGHLPKDPGRKYQASWSNQLWLRPVDHEQVLSLQGGARIRSTDFGGLNADNIHLWLKDDPRTPQAPAEATILPASHTEPAAASKLGSINAKVAPDRLMAEGNVKLDSQQLTGSTDRLEVWIQQVATGGLPADSSQGVAFDGAAPASQPRANTAQYDLGGKLVRVQAISDGKRTQVDDVWVDGQASLTETKVAHAGDKPFKLRGAQLHLAKATTSRAKVTVIGEPATIEGRGMTLVGGRIQLERSTNRMWVEGPGRMSMPVTGDLTGSGTSMQAQNLVVTWQEGMDFDGRTVSFRQGVVAKTEHQSLRTDVLQVRLTKPIDFNNPRGAQSDARPEVEQVSCAGGAFFEGRSFDQQGQTSIDRMELLDLTANRVTGAISGKGPGWLTTIRRGASRSMFAPAGAPLADDGRPKFSFLKVTFQKSLTGNLNRREITFADQTKSVYGPVAGWDAQLDADHPDSLGMDGVLLTSDQLTVRTAPGTSGKQPPIELETTGNTFIEGRQGTVTARAHQLTYSQSKDLLILKGGRGADAQLFRQAVAGGPTSRAAAREIHYWPSTNQMKWEDARYIDIQGFNQLSLPGSSK